MMENFLKYAVAFLLMFTLLLPAGSSMAQDQQADGIRLSNGKDLGGWWNMSPDKYKATPNTLLYHLEGNISYSETDGNTEMENQNVGMLVVLRKDNLTSATNYSKSLTSIGDTKVESDQLTQMFYLSFGEIFQPGVGIVWRSNDSTKRIDNRYIYYAGFQSKLIDLPKVNLTVGANYGFVDTAYMDGVDSYDSDGIYLKQTLNYKLTDTVGFSLNGDYLYYLKDSEYYLWNLAASFDLKVTENISFAPMYSISYDKNSYQQKMGTKARDTKLSLGIRFSF